MREILESRGTQTLTNHEHGNVLSPRTGSSAKVVRYSKATAFPDLLRSNRQAEISGKCLARVEPTRTSLAWRVLWSKKQDRVYYVV
jgi:hypothetical protein